LLPTEYDGAVISVPPELVVADRTATVAADWFKIQATATGRTGEFDQSKLGQLKTATASLVQVDESNVAIVIAAGNDEDTVVLQIAVADRTSVESGVGKVISGDDFGDHFSSALDEIGISVVGNVEADKIIDGSHGATFNQVFGVQYKAVSSDAVLSLAVLDSSVEGRHASMYSILVAAPVAGVLALVFFGVLMRRRRSAPAASPSDDARLALSASNIVSAEL